MLQRQRLRLQREFPRFEYGLYDQNGFAYVMAFQPELASGHYYLENDHIINGYWNDTSKYGQSVIINHFSGQCAPPPPISQLLLIHSCSLSSIRIIA